MKHLSFNRDWGKPRTVIILGAGRGGTSLVAGTLRCLGVSMGPNPHPLKHEWSPVVYTLEEQVDVLPTLKNIQAMDREHELWGWKAPIDLFSLDAIHPLLRSPALIIVTRDLVEVTLSWHDSVQTPWEIGFYESATVYQVIADRLRFWPYPAVAVSFHEIVSHSAEFVEFLVSFLEIEPTAAQKQQAAAFNRPGKNAYRPIGVTSPSTIGISGEELRRDIEGSSINHIERYTKSYLEHFAVMRGDTMHAIALLCERLEWSGNIEICAHIENRIRPLFALVPDSSGPNEQVIPSTSPASDHAAGRLSTTLHQLVHRITSAARSCGESLKTRNSESTGGYLILREMHRILLLLIRLRTELQKGLQLTAP